MVGLLTLFYKSIRTYVFCFIFYNILKFIKSILVIENRLRNDLISLHLYTYILQVPRIICNMGFR